MIPARDCGSLPDWTASCGSRARRDARRLLSGAAFSALGMTVLMLTSSIASAQDAVDVGAKSQPADGNDIIVTAQRRSERLENVPVAIAAVSGEELAKADVLNIHELNRVASGVQLDYAGAFTGVAVRGVSTTTNGNNIENNVAIYIDGFYEPNGLAINMDLLDLAGIEVLKGPQGTLYGRNATGGAILVNTLEPSRTFTGRAELTYARFDDKRASAYVSGPLSEHVRFGVSASYLQSDGYLRLIDPVTPGVTHGGAAPIEKESVRAKLQFDLGSSLTATLAYSYAYVNDPRTQTFSPRDHVQTGLYIGAIGAGANPNGANPPLFVTDPFTISYTRPTTVPSTSHQGTLTLKWDLGLGSLTSYTGYRYSKVNQIFDFDGSAVDTSFNALPYKQDTYQQALDLVVTSIDGLDLVVGGSYYHDYVRSVPDESFSYGANLVLSGRTVAGGETDSWAIYADATYHLTEALSLNLGGRYSEEKKSARFESFTFPGGVQTVQIPLTERNAKYMKFTPRVSVRYEVAPRTNIYASFTKGFRPGAISFSGPIQAAPQLYQFIKEENITAYEVGLKTASRLLRLDLSGFYYDYRNLQVNTLQRSPLCPPEPAACGQLNTVFGNAPKAEIYGVDGSISLTPTERLNLRAGAAYLHGRYKDFPNATGTGLSATGANVTQLQDWSDQQLVRAPTFAGYLGADYNVPMGDGGLLFSGNVNYTDSYVISNPSLFGPAAGAALANKQRFRTNGYALVSANATYTDATGHYYVGVFGKNLTNKLYRISYNGGAFGDYSTYGEPRTYGVKVGFKY
jgi:iron complex outermembrane recepter protein